ncbi:MAG: RNA-directed DNA polymerase [Chloroflexi bacterium]|nr:RNA-directed DNA polymerase [Chloroflexota bacterium]
MKSLPLLVSLPTTVLALHLLARELGWTEDQREQARAFYQRGMPPLVDTHTLPFLFGVSPRLIADMRRNPRGYYRRFRIRKKAGGQRSILAPRRFIKVIQTWILRHVLEHADIHECATGFRKDTNIFDNAAPHVGNSNLLVVDIKDFFGSVDQSSVSDSFRTLTNALDAPLTYPRDVAEQLADLCTVDGSLPQGAPGSPVLANISMRGADQELASLAESWGCGYTRYADDLAFSGPLTFSEEHVAGVVAILARHGFEQNSRKTRIIGMGGRQVIAGVVVNAVAQPPRWKRRRWRAMFHRAATDPTRVVAKEAYLQGVASFVNQYSPSLATEYHSIVQGLQ